MRSAGASFSVAVGSGALAVLAPKCPACVAAWLTALGLGAGFAADFAPWLRPAAWSIVAAGAVATAALLYRRRRRARSNSHTSQCCGAAAEV